ncbi:hypothetical protein CDN99_06590 [Roseateles aquatilis]|uniref:Uncharacterized protein n=1 Tax=Roseateles aquatilis TaxID=431061 RepID=A0A246JHM4_9BURK|nr:hypothetical protein [Roseateles aquatilis]OWQ92020.1 hypothetical protein CDN99_06590 [Roseateles aquatilis]
MTSVTLIDGRQVDSASEEWRAECAKRHEEARRVADMPSNEARKRYIDTVRASRGDQAAQRLRKAAFELMGEGR